MNKIYLPALTGLVFTFLVGCQSSPSTNFFSSGNSPQNLRAAVSTAFMNNPDLASVPIQIDVQNGTVLLSGYVKTIRQSDNAAEIASKISGVKYVQNGLIVRK
ncbi:MAG: BON domain-containing protein [Tatlockia sp.]|nr:BON domain-containing protein [Tatlockia sp.]